MKLTLKDVRFCLRGAKDLCTVYREEGKIYARIEWKICNNWTAMQNLKHYYNIVKMPETIFSRTMASDVYLIESVKQYHIA